MILDIARIIANDDMGYNLSLEECEKIAQTLRTEAVRWLKERLIELQSLPDVCHWRDHERDGAIYELQKRISELEGGGK